MSTETKTEGKLHKLVVNSDEEAQLWKDTNDTFTIEWSCGETYGFKFKAVEEFLADLDLTKKAKFVRLYASMEGIEVHGDLDEYVGYREGRDLIVLNVDNSGSEVAQIRVESLKRVLKRVKDGPVSDGLGDTGW